MPYARPSSEYEAVALTDHDGVYGSLEFAHAAKAVGLRAITGAEVTLTDGSHLTLLVEDERGYANLCRLLTRAHRDTRPAGRERDLLPPALPLDDLLARADGLVCLTGCARHGLATRDPNAIGRRRPRVRTRPPPTSSCSARTRAATCAATHTCASSRRRSASRRS